MNWSNGVSEYRDITLKPLLHYSNIPEKLEQNSQFKGLLRLEDREPLNHPA